MKKPSRAKGGRVASSARQTGRRDLIVEAPHVYATNAKLEGRTDTEGVLTLRQTLGRGLRINGADRCQGSHGGCGGTFSSATVCADANAGGTYRQSDAGK